MAKWPKTYPNLIGLSTVKPGRPPSPKIKKRNSGDQIKENADLEQLRLITLRMINAMRLGYD